MAFAVALSILIIGAAAVLYRGAAPPAKSAETTSGNGSHRSRLHRRWALAHREREYLDRKHTGRGERTDGARRHGPA